MQASFENVECHVKKYYLKVNFQQKHVEASLFITKSVWKIYYAVKSKQTLVVFEKNRKSGPFGGTISVNRQDWMVKCVALINLTNCILGNVKLKTHKRNIHFKLG